MHSVTDGRAAVQISTIGADPVQVAVGAPATHSRTVGLPLVQVIMGVDPEQTTVGFPLVQMIIGAEPVQGVPGAPATQISGDAPVQGTPGEPATQEIGVTVTVALALLVGSATLVARTWKVPASAGAV
jgi:hypothetical protein